jgi:ATP-dependent helicase HrpA
VADPATKETAGGSRPPRARTSSRQRRPRGPQRATALVEARRQAVPEITFPVDLPVSERKDDIAAAIRDHQVVIVAGETGSGKTTQLPKICLELGRGIDGLIGHTQPRRIAARSVAERIAEELRTPLGEAVGYQVRFTDHHSDRTLVKVMTDGILLAEIARDRLLRKYDTLIIDEAHERSLNVDFLLGYLKNLLPRRPDLKIIVTSATIDTARFAAHFADESGAPAPVVEVSGRTYPVHISYQPYGVGEGDDRDQVQAVCDAVTQLTTQGPGDILVFFSGEREIRDATEALQGLNLRHTEIVPLYGRLSAAEQHRVFESHTGRRVVLATNVAETSLTVPGVRYVVDTGTARISRYSHRLKVQRLPIEAISQASANQRSGRCGRVADGIAIRLYSEEDFLSRPLFTEPEILRTNLASVILAMTSLDLGDIAAFPFLEAPDHRQIRDGLDLLRELGALATAPGERHQRLTPTGRKLAQLPLDPRLGRMVLAADSVGALAEVLVIAAALSIQDPRERPLEHQQAADQQHRRFADPTSDFAALLNLWRHIKEQQKELSGNQFRRMCKSEFLHYLRIREWQDLHSQLRQSCRDLGLVPAETPAAADTIHQALLAGLLSHIGSLDAERRDYLGARGARFSIHPGSSLSRKPPAFVMAAELVETSRLFARVAARVDPLWIEQIAGDLVTRNYSEPRWSKRRAAVVATERVSLYGVPLVVGRTIQFGRIDPVVSRDLFIRHALVLGEWDAHHAFLRQNSALVAEVTDLEERVRRRDLLTDEQTLVDFFEARIPADVVSGRHFDKWWKVTRQKVPDLLSYPRELLVEDDVDTTEAFPRTWTFGGTDLPDLPLAYAFEPGADHDGVTVEVPVTLLGRLQPEEFLRQVPGRREEIVRALIRSLPKNMRTRLVPMPETIRAVLPHLVDDVPLPETLATALTRHGGFPISAKEFDLTAVPDHLRITFRVVNEMGEELGRDRDLRLLRTSLAPTVQATLSAVTARVQRQGLTAFPEHGVAREIDEPVSDHVLTGYPALVDRGDRVDLVVLPTSEDQFAAMRGGVRRLLLLAIPNPSKPVIAGLSPQTKLALGYTPYATVPIMVADLIAASVDSLVESAGGLPFDRSAYDTLLLTVRQDLFAETSRAAGRLSEVLAAARQVRSLLDGMTGKPLQPLVYEVGIQLDQLVYDGFVSEIGVGRLPDLVRYLKAAAQRLEKAPQDLARDQVKAQEVAAATSAVEAVRLSHPGKAAEQLRWMLEELRVSLFAQKLRTPYPVSSTRVLRAVAALS